MLKPFFVASLFILISFFSGVAGYAQKQLLLLKNGHVMHRFNAGDDIYIKVKGNPDRIHSYVNNILDDALVLQKDTIPYHTIERTYLYESARRNANGSVLLLGGILLFGIDFANQEWVQKTDYKATSGISIASGVLVAAGLPLAFIKKKSQLLGYKYRLMPVKAGDPLYR